MNIEKGVKLMCVSVEWVEKIKFIGEEYLREVSGDFGELVFWM